MQRDLQKPKAFIDVKTTALQQLQIMLMNHPDLYEKCLNTEGFAYGFNQLSNRAIHYDYIMLLTEEKNENEV